MRGEVQGSLARVLACAQIHTFLQKELDHILATVFTGPNEARLHLRFRNVRFRTAVVGEKTLRNIEPSNARSSLEIQMRAARGEKLGGLWTIVGEAAVDRALVVAGSSMVIDNGPVIQQHLHERSLHTGPLRMDACCHQAESGGSATIHVCFGIDFRAGLQQNLRDLCSILWRLLTITLDTIGRYVMQERSSMFARRASANQFLLFPQQPLKCRDVSFDDRIRGSFESGHRRTFPRGRFEVFRKLRPTFEAM